MGLLMAPCEPAQDLFYFILFWIHIELFPVKKKRIL